ncbi:uncharacterized protein LOC143295439 isoform X2 [Babylonia areolata]
MQMFFSPVTHSTLIVQGWTTATFTGMVLGIAAGAVLSIGLECLKSYMATRRMCGLQNPPCGRLSISKRLLSTLAHTMNVLVGYLLMLIVMTFNIYILIAIVAGAGLGHFVFRPLFFHHFKRRLHRAVVNVPSDDMEEDVCQDCAISSEAQEAVQRIEPFGSVVKVTEEEGEAAGSTSDSKEHGAFKSKETII